MMPCRRSASRVERTAVGSSKTMTRTSWDSALAISTTCWCATARSPTARRGVDVEPEPVEEVARPPVQARPRDDGRQLPHEDVLGHRQVGGERRLLMDYRDAARCRDARIIALLGFAADEDLAGVTRDFAGQDAHQRRLAGPVLAEQGVHLAGPDVEIDGLQGPHSSEGPRDALELDEVRHPTVPIRSTAGGLARPAAGRGVAGFRRPRWAS